MFLSAIKNNQSSLFKPKENSDPFKKSALSKVGSGLFGGVAGAAAASSPLLASLSPLLVDYVNSKQQTEKKAEAAFKQATPEQISNITNNYGGGDTKKGFINLQKTLEKLSTEKEGKDSDVFKEFQSLFGFDKSEKSTSERTESSSVNELKEILQKIAESTSTLVEKVSTTNNTNTLVSKSTNTRDFKGSNLLKTLMTKNGYMVNNTESSVMAGSTTSDTSSTAQIDNYEDRKDVERIFVSQTEKTNDLLSEIKESIRQLVAETTKSITTNNTPVAPVPQEQSSGPNIDIDIGSRKRRGRLGKLLKGAAALGSTAISGMLGIPAIESIGGNNESSINVDLPGIETKSPKTPDLTPEKKGIGSLLKTGGKSFLKKIPILGALAGVGFAGSKLLDGDVTGAGLELASGVAGAVPGVGTLLSTAIDAYSATRDTSTDSNSVLDKLLGSSSNTVSLTNQTNSVESAQSKVEPTINTIKNSLLEKASKDSTLKELATLSSNGFSNVTVEKASQLTESIDKKIAEYSKDSSTSSIVNQLQSYREQLSNVTSSSVNSTTLGNNSISSLVEPKVGNQTSMSIMNMKNESDNVMMEKQAAPSNVIIQGGTSINTSGNTQTQQQPAPRPMIRNQEPTLLRMQERDYWNKVK